MRAVPKIKKMIEFQFPCVICFEELGDNSQRCVEGHRYCGDCFFNQDEEVSSIPSEEENGDVKLRRKCDMCTIDRTFIAAINDEEEQKLISKQKVRCACEGQFRYDFFQDKHRDNCIPCLQSDMSMLDYKIIMMKREKQEMEIISEKNLKRLRNVREELREARAQIDAQNSVISGLQFLHDTRTQKRRRLDFSESEVITV